MVKREKYKELEDLFLILEDGNKGEFSFKILNGNVENNGLKFKIIQINCKTQDAFDFASDIVSIADFEEIYKATKCYKNYQKSMKQIRVIILNEELEECKMNLMNIRWNECKNYCQDYYYCKRYKQTTYEIELRGNRPFEPCISIIDTIHIKAVCDSMVDATKVMSTIKDSLFGNLSSVITSVHPESIT